MNLNIGDRVKYGDLEYIFIVVGKRKYPTFDDKDHIYYVDGRLAISVILEDGVFIKATGVGKKIYKKTMLVSSNRLERIEH
jgi:hypothetical protein